MNCNVNIDTESGKILRQYQKPFSWGVPGNKVELTAQIRANSLGGFNHQCSRPLHNQHLTIRAPQLILLLHTFCSLERFFIKTLCFLEHFSLRKTLLPITFYFPALCFLEHSSPCDIKNQTHQNTFILGQIDTSLWFWIGLRKPNLFTYQP